LLANGISVLGFSSIISLLNFFSGSLGGLLSLRGFSGAETGLYAFLT